MKSSDLLIVGALAVVALWLWRRRRSGELATMFADDARGLL
jgi:hypothetical protein